MSVDLRYTWPNVILRCHMTYHDKCLVFFITGSAYLLFQTLESDNNQTDVNVLL